ncbi:hypothetical protein [Sinomicrobium sp. M5D2P9]
MTKKFSEYYPNQIAKDNKYEKYLKDENRLYRECRKPHFESEKVGVKKAYVYQEFHLWKEWKNGGKNIFHFSKNLVELLRETDVLDIDLSLIKLPYSSLYIDLSEAKIPFEENGNEFIDGVFIRDEQDDGDDGQSFERAINIDFVGRDYIEKYWTINKDLCWDSERGFHSMLLFLDRKDNLKTVEDAVKFDKKGFVGEYTFDERDDDTKIDLYLIHKQFVDRTISLAINCLLYLTTKESDVTEKYPEDLPIHLKTKLEKANTKKKKETAKTNISESGFTKIKYVGYRIKTIPPKESTGKEVAAHWRRGHWRNQKFGVNLTESKLVWIMPTIVNKEKGEPKKGHLYEIE